MNATRPVRSIFVTVVAGLFIAVSSLAIFTAITQIVVLSIAFPAIGAELTSQAKLMTGQPWIVTFMMRHFQAIFVCFLAVSVVSLVASTGLLLRRNWARILFVAMMVLAIAWQLIDVVLGFVATPNAAEMMGDVGADLARYVDWFTKGMAVFNAATSIAFALVFAWIIKRLMSKAVRNEFGVLE